MWMDSIVGVNTLVEILYPVTFLTKVFYATAHNHIDVGNAGAYAVDIRNVGLSSLYAGYPYREAKAYFLIIGY